MQQDPNEPPDPAPEDGDDGGTRPRPVGATRHGGRDRNQPAHPQAGKQAAREQRQAEQDRRHAENKARERGTDDDDDGDDDDDATDGDLGGQQP